MNLIHPKSRAVFTPYGYFNSITDAAKFIFETDKTVRARYKGRHSYNAVVNLRRWVKSNCDNRYKGWGYIDE
jgi:hypothetical protein